MSILLTLAMLLGMTPWVTLDARATDLPSFSELPRGATFQRIVLDGTDSDETRVGTVTYTEDGTEKAAVITFQKWDSGNSLPSSGKYYLTQDVTLSTAWQIGGNVTICLNGHTIQQTAQDSVIFIQNGYTLDLFDNTTSGTITGGKSDYNGGGVYINNGRFNMYGGKLTGNTAAQNGSAVGIGNYGKFYMYGGEISDNTAGGYGAVCNSGSGTIGFSGKVVVRNNKAGSQEQEQASDVCLDGYSTISLTGPLSGGTQIGVSRRGSDEVVDSYDYRYMEGLNPADYFFSNDPDRTVISLNDYGYVMLSAEPATMTKLTSWNDGDGSYDMQLGYGTTLSGKVKASFRKDKNSTEGSAKTVIFSTELRNAKTENDYSDSATRYLNKDDEGSYFLDGSYYLTEDLALDQSLIVEDVIAYLDLAGHTLTIQSENPAVSVGSCGQLYLFDSSEGKTGKIINSGTGSAVCLSDGGAELYMFGSTVSGKSYGVKIEAEGNSFYLYGGKITGCGSNGVMNYDVFNMYGGEITENTVTEAGGGVFNNGSFTLYNGVISNNTTTNNGGGVCVSNGTFALRGGSIINNEARDGGAGVFMNNTVLTVSGAPVVRDNKFLDKSEASNIATYQLIAVDKALSAGAQLGVTLLPDRNGERFGDGKGVFTDGEGVKATTQATALGYFFSDEGYAVLPTTQAVDGVADQLKLDNAYPKPTANTLTYNGSSQALVTEPEDATGYIFQYSTTEEGDYGTTVPTGKDAGSYEVWYKVFETGKTEPVGGPAKLTVSIAQKAITVSGITAENKTYDGNTTATLVYTGVSLAGLIEGDGLTITAVGTFDTANAGEGKTVTISNLALSGAAKDNYVLAEEGQQASTTANINKRSVTVTAKPQSVELNGSTTTDGLTLNAAITDSADITKVVTVDGLLDGHSLSSVTLEAETSAVTTTGTVTPKNAAVKSGSTVLTGNYSFTYASGTLTVTPSQPTVTWPMPGEITYGDPLSASALTGGSAKDKYDSTKAVEGTFTWKEPDTKPAVSDSGKTEYTIVFTPTDTESYGPVEHTVKITVNKAALTVTANSQTKTYGDADPELSYTVTGLKNGDTVAEVLKGSLSREAGANVSESGYDITQGTLTLTNGKGANYTISFTGAKLVIQKRRITVTPKAQTVYIDGAASSEANDAEASNILDGDKISEIKISGDTASVTEAGKLTATGAKITNGSGVDVSANYDVAYSEGALTVTLRPAPDDFVEMHPSYPNSANGRITKNRVNGVDIDNFTNLYYSADNGETWTRVDENGKTAGNLPAGSYIFQYRLNDKVESPSTTVILTPTYDLLWLKLTSGNADKQANEVGAAVRAETSFGDRTPEGTSLVYKWYRVRENRDGTAERTELDSTTNEYNISREDAGCKVLAEVTWKIDDGGAVIKVLSTPTPIIISEKPEKYSVGGTVNRVASAVDTEGTACDGALVELRQGNTVIATANTDVSGNYSFSDIPEGEYNIVVAKGDVTKSERVTVEDGSVEKTVLLPYYDVSSLIVVRGNTPAVVIGSLDDLAKTESEGITDGQSIEVKLTVEGKDDLTDVDDDKLNQEQKAEKTDQAEIKEKALAATGAGTVVEFIDMGIVKSVTTNGNATTEAIRDTGSNILQIRIPYVTEGRYQFGIYRKHVDDFGNEQTIAFANNGSHADGTFEVGNGYLVVFATKFSTYAIGYTTTAPVYNSGVTSAYPVNVNETEYGSASADKRNAAAGEKVTVTATPDDGYVLRAVTVVGSNGAFIATTKNADGTVSFRMPASEVSVTAKFLATPEKTGVADMLITDDHILYIHGYPEGIVAPNDNISRAEVAMIFYRLLKDKNVAITVSFSDVPENAWYAQAVNTLASLGIINGIGDSKFDPARKITRAEFTAIATRFAHSNNGTHHFDDVAVGYWAERNIATAYDYGWIEGTGENLFAPTANITRAETCAIVNRMLGRAADEAYVTENRDKLAQFPDLQDAAKWYYLDMVEAANEHDFTKTNGVETWTK
ncbi:MAG: S-layer homology domain-containing protein [Oscillospiraceae bacterium]|nr:S-layer homology domain-containing protein [Oscillospiraceae bacterium]